METTGLTEQLHYSNTMAQSYATKIVPPIPSSTKQLEVLTALVLDLLLSNNKRALTAIDHDFPAQHPCPQTHMQHALQ
jgi:hypothetical protein